MKKVCLFILTLVSFTASGQILIGVKGGPSFTNATTGSFFDNTHFRIGFSGGLSFEYFLKENFSLGADIIVSMKGFRSDVALADDFGPPSDQKVTVKLNYDYLSLPLKTGWHIGKKKVTAFGNVGIVPSLLISAKTIAPPFEDHGEYYPAETYDVRERVNAFDLAGLIEFGTHYKITETFWLLGSIYGQYSFTSITTDEYFSGDKMRHYGVGVSFGLKYKL